MKSVLFAILKSTTCLMTIVGCGHAAVVPDRTRVIFNERSTSVSLVLSNQSKALPYLAQSWIEDATGRKNRNFIIALPPLLRLEPTEQTQVRLAKQLSLNQLPRDRESLFYYNVREVPPKADKPNTMQIAMQSKIKIFYRPKAIEIKTGEVLPFDKVIVERTNEGLNFSNNTPYYITLGYIGMDGKSLFPQSESVMLSPFSKGGAKVKNLPAKFKIGYIGDYGGLTLFSVNCNSVQRQCAQAAIERGK